MPFPLSLLFIDFEGGRIALEREGGCDFVILLEEEIEVVDGRGGLNAFGGMFVGICEMIQDVPLVVFSVDCVYETLVFECDSVQEKSRLTSVVLKCIILCCKIIP